MIIARRAATVLVRANEIKSAEDEILNEFTAKTFGLSEHMISIKDALLLFNC
jgi:hypothetical protein